ncbi:hypothetical protein [Achromobacter spanius]|uniref:hypothetical protein n=1 Tax=Achromobacter spanius TaxID=217203 RepID=UPI003801FF30
MSRFPPLSPRQIAALWAQSDRCAELRRAIWELHRHQQILLLVDRFMGQVQDQTPCVHTELRYQLMAILESEPVVRIERARIARAARRRRPSLFAGGQVPDADQADTEKRDRIIQAP